MNDRESQHEIEPLLVLTAQTKTVRNVADVPGGDRMIVDVVGGSFEGPRLRGRILPSGGDWVTRIANRSRMEVRLLLETHDGTTILLQYRGKAHQAAGNVRIEVVGSFDAPAGPV